MSTHATFRPAAGRTVSGPGRRRPTDPVKVQQLEALRSRLEQLILDMRYRAEPSIRAFERSCEEAESIGAGIRAVFRGGALPPENPPLEHRGGKAWW